MKAYSGEQLVMLRLGGLFAFLLQQWTMSPSGRVTTILSYPKG
jgi:hypothetical protein